jgi:hypothetical protein
VERWTPQVLQAARNVDLSTEQNAQKSRNATLAFREKMKTGEE